MDRGPMYAEVRERISAMVRAAAPAQLGGRVPAAPDWTIFDLLGHLAGTVADVADGNIADAGTDSWTAAQVTARKGRDLESLLAEWEELSPVLEGVLDQVPQAALALADVATHEQDIAGALAVQSGRGSASYDAALQLYLGDLDDRLLAAGQAVCIKAGNDEWVLGAGEPIAVASTDTHELFRAVSGRRAFDQIREWSWEGDTSVVALLPRFTPPERRIVD